MNIWQHQKRLIELIKPLGVTVTDNILVPYPTRFPFIAVDADAAHVTTYEGGTLAPQVFRFDIYVVTALKDHGERLPLARLETAKLADQIIKIPRLYASELSYGEDVLGTTRCSLALIKCSFPYA